MAGVVHRQRPVAVSVAGRIVLGLGGVAGVAELGQDDLNRWTIRPAHLRDRSNWRSPMVGHSLKKQAIEAHYNCDKIVMR